jgi:maleate isomerase
LNSLKKKLTKTMSDIPHRTPTTDTIAYRAKVAVVVPATNTVVQPEMEAMRPPGVTNHVTRMLLPPRPYDDQVAYKMALETEEGNLEEALRLVLVCEPHVVAHGHSIHSFRGDGQRAIDEENRLEALCGIPFITPSRAVLAGLEAIGNPKRIAILTPYWGPANDMIDKFFISCGYDVVASHGLQSTGPTAVARFTAEQIMQGFEAVDKRQADVLIHVGTNLPVSSMTPAIEKKFGKPLIGVNVATYWLALRRLGITDKLPGMGLLGEQY